MFRILYGGCESRHPSSFIMSRPEGVMNYILLIIRSPGEFQIGHSHYVACSGQAIIIDPQTPYYYSNPDGEYVDDWLHFEVTDNSAFRKLYPMTNELFSIGNTDPYTRLILQLLWEKSYTPAEYLSQNTNALFSVLLNHLAAAYHSKNTAAFSNTFYEQFQSLRLELQNTIADGHRIKDHAKKLNISESYFQHLYTDFFGISFQKDVIQMRIERAKYLLTTSDLTMVQVAALCGYSNEVHFYRQFKKTAGTTPADYRKGFGFKR